MSKRKGRRGKRKSRKVKPRRGISSWVISLLVIGFVLIVVVSLGTFLNPLKPNDLEETSIKGAVIVDQFYSQNPDFTNQTVELLRNVNMEVDVYKDEDVTVELYRNLPTHGYRLIILRVHAGISVQSKDMPTVLFTSEEYSTSRYVAEQLSDQIVCGFFGVALELEQIEPLLEVLAISPKFVRNSMEGNFQDAIIVLSSCFGLYTKDLAEALIERGAKVFVSWDERVSLEHTDEAVLDLLKAFVYDDMPIGKAVDRVMKVVGPDPVYQAVLKYYPAESSNYVLEGFG